MDHPLKALGLSLYLWACLMMAVLILSSCAFRYDKATGGYTGAIACVDITGPGFSWKCNEGSKVPTLPDGQYVPEKKP